MIVNAREARAKLAELLELAARGEVVEIAERGKAHARLVPIAAKEPRRPGLAKGRLTSAFFEPLPPDELAAWHQ